MAQKPDSITLSSLADYDTATLEWAQKTLAREITKRERGDVIKLKKQFAKIAGVMGFALVAPEPDTARGRKKGIPTSPAGKQEERAGGKEEKKLPEG